MDAASKAKLEVTAILDIPPDTPDPVKYVGSDNV
jgi:hypothetical protein